MRKRRLEEKITRKDGPATNPAPRKYQSGAMDFGDEARVSFTVCSSSTSSSDATQLFCLLHGHEQGLKILDLVCVFVCVLPGGVGKAGFWDTDDDWGDELVTDTSRPISVGKKTKLVHGTQRIRTARDASDVDDWEELVTSSSRVSYVGNKTERKVHGTQRRIRTARERLFRSGGRPPCTVVRSSLPL